MTRVAVVAQSPVSSRPIGPDGSQFRYFYLLKCLSKEHHVAFITLNRSATDRLSPSPPIASLASVTTIDLPQGPGKRWSSRAWRLSSALESAARSRRVLRWEQDLLARLCAAKTEVVVAFFNFSPELA